MNKTKVHETPIVENCGGDLMRWMGPGSCFQMYCALLLSGSLVYQADASANMMEVRNAPFRQKLDGGETLTRLCLCGAVCRCWQQVAPSAVRR